MYIYLIYADIKIVLTAIILIFSILIFTIFIYIDIKFDKDYGKIQYKIKVFFIKILYGYIEKASDGIIIHLNRRKAVLIYYKNLFGMKEKVKPLKDYHLIKFYSELNIGVRDNFLLSFEIGYFYNFISEIISWITYHKKPYFKLSNYVNVYENKNIFKYECDSTVVFNLLMVTISLIKILVGKIYYAIRNRLQQN